MSGAGKTTLAIALRDAIKPRLPQTVLIDGDIIRAAFGPSLGYSESERRTQIDRIQKLAKILDDQDQIVIVAALYAHPDLLNWNRQNFNSYFEVYLEASMDLLKRRDQKDLYSSAQSGDTEHVVGFDIPWNAPTNPDAKFIADQELTPHEMAVSLSHKIPSLDVIHQPA